jgi:hypothetical protein
MTGGSFNTHGDGSRAASPRTARMSSHDADSSRHTSQSTISDTYESEVLHLRESFLGNEGLNTSKGAANRMPDWSFCDERSLMSAVKARDR